MTAYGPKSEVPAASNDVRVYVQSGRHILVLSSSHFDPDQKSHALAKVPEAASNPHYSPKYFSAIWMPSSYMFWNFPCSPRLVLREKNSVTCAIGVSRRRSSASICVVDPTSINPSRS